MTRTHWLGAAVLALFTLAASPTAQSANQSNHDHAAPAAQGGVRQGGMMHDHQRMMADLTAQQARLEKLVTAMNSAAGEPKIEAIAALLTQLVTDLNSAQHHMMEMHAGMTSHK
jgi:hypothetical protein